MLVQVCHGVSASVALNSRRPTSTPWMVVVWRKVVEELKKNCGIQKLGFLVREWLDPTVTMQVVIKSVKAAELECSF